MTFKAGENIYTYEIKNTRSPVGVDRSCVTVEISDDTGKTWIGQIDIANERLTTSDTLIGIGLIYAFTGYDVEKIPANFEIPAGYPQADPVVHQCSVQLQNVSK